MSVPHHGTPEQQDLQRRFLEEITGVARREFPLGRLGADDDGSMTFAIADDPSRGITKIVFSKPTQWLGLDRAALRQLITRLEESEMALRGLAKPKEST